jgi:hypothetical protein
MKESKGDPAIASLTMIVAGCTMLFSVTLLPFMLPRDCLAFLPVWLFGVMWFGMWAGAGALIGGGIFNFFGGPTRGAALEQ